MFVRFFLTALLAALFIILPVSHAYSLPKIPASLEQWSGWVLDGYEKELCTRAVNSKMNICQWSGPLDLELDSTGGTFSQVWTLESQGWLALPGSDKHWPLDVSIDGVPAVVVEHESNPSIRVEKPGRFTVQGRFSWNALPDFLTLPANSAITSRVVINGRKVELPEIEKGRLWIRNRQHRITGMVNRMDINVSRLVDDSVPLLLETRIALQVSGIPREVTLGWKTPANMIPFRLESPLPARLEKDGRLRLKVRPGNWTITYVTRSKGPVSELVLEPSDDAGPWPDFEYWVFKARPELRVVAVSGLKTVDPSITTLPAKWRNLPAYLIRPGQKMVLEEKRRGDSDPAPDELSLERTFWLDQDGNGLTVLDKLTGTISRSWRLDAGPGMKPGRITIDGRDQLITRLSPEDAPGVEVRRGTISLAAVSRIKTGEPLYATGWRHDMQHLSARLNLPPGWRLLHVTGVDRASTWVSRWTLFDIFIVLITVLSAGRLYSWPAAAASAVAMVLAFHEPDAPVMIWLLLMGTAALMRVGKGHRFYGTVSALWYITAVLAVISIIPFSITQVRTGIYPQLERAGQIQLRDTRHDYAETESLRRKSMPLTSLAGKARMVKDLEKMGMSAVPAPASIYSNRIYQPDILAKIQTGPGLPAWRWKHAELSWNGPVESVQKIKLYLASPAMNLTVALLRVIFLFLMAYFIIFKETLPAIRLKAVNTTSVLSIFIVLCAVSSLFSPAPAASEEFPPQAMLDELRQKLLEPPECYPGCASIETMTATLDQDGKMELVLDTGAAVTTAIPLPRGKSWHPVSILIDGHAPLLFAHKGETWIKIPIGLHQVKISGKLQNAQPSLFLPLKPHRAVIHAAGWDVEGVNPDGVPEKQIQFSITAKKDSNEKAFAPETLPPFVKVRRVIHLGIEWHVTTIVTRLSPKGSPIILNITLLPGESVITDGMRVRNGMVACSMEPYVDSITWRSVLEKNSSIVLIAPDTTEWIEEWILEADQLWHIEMKGIPVIFHKSQAGPWHPQWHPWPGEKVEIAVTRPEAVTGPTKTIDSTRLVIKPGLRMTKASLDITARSSRGDSINLVLPDGSSLEAVKINGETRTVRQRDREVVLPLDPGSQKINVTWHSSEGITRWFRIPEISLGMPTVNSTIELAPGNRWIWYLRGPVTGPAILFYSEIAVLLLVSVILGMSGLTPLKTWQWMLLAFGLSQSGLVAEGLVAAWLLVLGLRQRFGNNLKGFRFNAVQAALFCLTLAAMGGLVFAVHNGLLGQPDMRIAGNGSSSHLLRWYSDRTGSILPTPGVFSFSILAYRLVMLAWALWLAASLLGWIKWGWQAYSSGKLWDSVDIRLRRRNNKEKLDKLN